MQINGLTQQQSKPAGSSFRRHGAFIAPSRKVKSIHFFLIAQSSNFTCYMCADEAMNIQPQVQTFPLSYASTRQDVKCKSDVHPPREMGEQE
jgi:hypothetical protein